MSHRMKNEADYRDAYLTLVKKHPLVSIRSAAQLRKAQKMIDSLLARGQLDPGAEKYLDALSDLVGVYEDEHVDMGKAGDAELLKHLMEARAISQSELAAELGLPKSTVSDLINGKRELTRAQVVLAAQYFGVQPSVFLAKS